MFGPADAPPSSGQSSPPEPPPATPAVDVLGVVVVNAGHTLNGFISQAHFAAEVALQEPNLSPKVRRELEWLQRATRHAYRSLGYIRGAAAAAELGPEWLRGVSASMREFYGVPDDGSDPVWLTWAARSAQSDVIGNCLCMSISTAARGTRVSGDS